jgi:hypothetical protein
MGNIDVAIGHIEKPGKSQPREAVPPRIVGRSSQALSEKETPQRLVGGLGNISGGEDRARRALRIACDRIDNFQ